MSSNDNGDYVPRLNDILHLGKKGICVFAMNIKNSVVRNKKPQSRERFDGGRGGYRRAAERGASTASSRGSPQTGGDRRSPHRGGHNVNRFSPLADYHGDGT